MCTINYNKLIKNLYYYSSLIMDIAQKYFFDDEKKITNSQTPV